MTKTLLILENSPKITEEYIYVWPILQGWQGPVIDFTRLQSHTPQEIMASIMQCTHITAQTAVANGSQYQFLSIVHLLGAVKEPKTVYVKVLCAELAEYIDQELEDAELASIAHHSIHELDGEGFGERLNFDARLQPYYAKIAREKDYRDNGKARPTGTKVRILSCNGCGKAFQGLPVGEVVDVLDMSSHDPNSSRGVWVWGNGEPIKLINDCGLQEYELADVLTPQEVVEHFGRSTGIGITGLTALQLHGLVSVIGNVGYNSMDVANFICEQLEIPKRGNRAVAYKLISQYRSQFINATQVTL